MEEKFCTSCGKPFAGEGDLCEECLEKQTQVTEETQAPENTDYSLEETEETVLEDTQDDQEIPDESEFFVDYEEEEPPKAKNGAKITAMVLGLVGCLYGIYYVVMLIMNTIQQNAMMAQYGMASELGFLDFIPFIVMGIYFVCGIIGSVLPKKLAKASLILLLVPASWTLFNGIQLMTSLVPVEGMTQEVPTNIVVMYVAFLFAGIFCFVAGILHAVYLKYKLD